MTPERWNALVRRRRAQPRPPVVWPPEVTKAAKKRIGDLLATAAVYADCDFEVQRYRAAWTREHLLD